MHSNCGDVNLHWLHAVTCELPAIKYHKSGFFGGVCVLVFGFYWGFLVAFKALYLKKITEETFKRELFFFVGGTAFIYTISLLFL